MRNNSIAIFQIDGLPVLGVAASHAGPCLTLRDSFDGEFAQKIDFYIKNEDAEKLRAAAESFNAIMLGRAAKEAAE